MKIQSTRSHSDSYVTYAGKATMICRITKAIWHLTTKCSNRSAICAQQLSHTERVFWTTRRSARLRIHKNLNVKYVRVNILQWTSSENTSKLFIKIRHHAVNTADRSTDGVLVCPTTRQGARQSWLLNYHHWREISTPLQSVYSLCKPTRSPIATWVIRISHFQSI